MFRPDPYLYADLEPGLYRLIVKILHPNDGGSPDNPDPGLIMTLEAVFCPF